MIGDEIEITVLSVAGEKVRLGIKAPREIPVYRDEVYSQVNAQQLESDPVRPIP